MNEVQALNILTNLANEAQNGGLFKDINQSGAVYTALLVLSQGLPQPEAPEDQAGFHHTDDDPTDPQGDSE